MKGELPTNFELIINLKNRQNTRPDDSGLSAAAGE
jgi:hypothetical protein